MAKLVLGKSIIQSSRIFQVNFNVHMDTLRLAKPRRRIMKYELGSMNERNDFSYP